MYSCLSTGVEDISIAHVIIKEPLPDNRRGGPKNNLSKVEILTCEERLCIQCIYIAPYDNESEALQIMVHYAKKQEFALDF